MEREVSAILSPLGLEDSLSRRVAGALLQVEATLPAPAPHPSITQQILKAVGRRPRFSSGTEPDERAALLPKADEADDDKGLTAFLLKFGEGMEEVGDGRLLISAITIGLSYFLGGLVPLLPYFFIALAQDALWVSVAVTAVVLLLFGGFKQYFTGTSASIMTDW
jgi:VIT1/CCC1 family predicted Fe2+/Mn2+ transporter